MKGTPFIFQGQELGAVNQKFRSVNDFKDIESINLFHELVDGGESEEKAFATVLSGSRDHARAPMAWERNDEDPGWSAVEQRGDGGSVLEYYRRLIALRGSHKDSLTHGRFRVVHERSKNYFAYYRIARDEVFFIECNLSAAPRVVPRLGMAERRKELVMSNYESNDEDCDARVLLPYEARIYRILKNWEN
jgi:oligo-1,6-glucosidase